VETTTAGEVNPSEVELMIATSDLPVYIRRIRCRRFCQGKLKLACADEILETLISCHGIVPVGVKPDLYTAAGITSQHPTHIDSLVFRPLDHPLGDEHVKVSLRKAELTAATQTGI
jgi:hypothetical protein